MQLKENIVNVYPFSGIEWPFWEHMEKYIINWVDKAFEAKNCREDNYNWKLF